MAPGVTPSAAVAGDEQGVDVASFQHPRGAAIDWSQVAASGVGFAGVKATEGNYYQNPYALTDLAAAQAAGLSVVAYAFAIPNGDGTAGQQQSGQSGRLPAAVPGQRKPHCAAHAGYRV